MARNQQVGAAGEESAWQWYRSHGYALLARNWRAGRTGELDLVCARDTTVVFVEVKARSSGRFGTGLEAVTPRKQQQVRRVAMAWLHAEEHPFYPNMRFDVVAVDGRGHVTVVTDAF